MGTLCLSGAAVFKAGANKSTALVEADYDYAILQAESAILAATRYNWIDNYGTLNVDVKYILEQLCSDIAGMYLINYDPTTYGNETATIKLDFLRDSIMRNLSILRDKKTQDFINGA